MTENIQKVAPQHPGGRASHLAAALLALTLASPLGAAEIRWFSLVSADAAAAKAFYSRLFGWEFRTSRTGAHIALLGGKEIASISQIEDVDETSRESQWLPAFMVVDLAATVDRARRAGADLLAGITFVEGYGSYAVIRDPQGAVIMLSDTTKVPAAPTSAGNWIWGELWTTQPEGSAHFYEDMADLVAMHEETAGSDAYNVFVRDKENIAGFMPVEDPDFETRWGGYIAVDDLDATLSKAKELGGEVFDVNVDQHGAGRVAVLADPAGAVFFVYELKKTSAGKGS